MKVILILFICFNLYAENCNVGFYKVSLNFQKIADVQSQEIKDMVALLQSKGVKTELIRFEDGEVGFRILKEGDHFANKTLKRIEYFMESPNIIYKTGESSTALGYYQPSKHYIYLSKGVFENIDATGKITFFHEIRHALMNYRNYHATDNMSYLGSLHAKEGQIWTKSGSQKIIHNGYADYMNLEEGITWKKDIVKIMENLRSSTAKNDYKSIELFLGRIEKKVTGANLISEVHSGVFQHLIDEDLIGKGQYQLKTRVVNGRMRVEAEFEIAQQLADEKTTYTLKLPLLNVDPTTYTLRSQDELNAIIQEQAVNLYRQSIVNAEMTRRAKFISDLIVENKDNLSKINFYTWLFSSTSTSSNIEKNSTLVKSFLSVNGLDASKINLNKEKEAWDHLFGLIADVEPKNFSENGIEYLRYTDDYSDYSVVLETTGKFVRFEK